jgi:hypothetical protein
MKKPLKIVLISLGALVVLVVVAGVVALLALDSIVKAGTEKGGSYALKVPVKLDSAHISLLGGTANLKGFSVDNPAGYDQKSKALRFGEIFASVEPGSVTKDTIVIREVTIRGPEVYIEGNFKDGSNIQKLLKNLDETIGAGGPSAKKEGPGKKLRIGRILIEDAKVSLGATFLGGQAGSVTLPKIEIKDIGSGPDGSATPAEVAKKVLGAILTEAAKATGQVGDAMRQLGDQAGGALKGVGSGLKETGKGVLDGVKGIFKKDNTGKK